MYRRTLDFIPIEPLHPTGAWRDKPLPYKIEIAYGMLRQQAKDASPDVQAIIDNLEGVEPLGLGSEKIVYPFGETQVLAGYKVRKPPNVIREEFYRRKLAHTLAPDLIPDIHLAASQPSVLVVDRVEDVPLRGEGGEAKERAATQQTTAKLAELGIDIDAGNSNFVINALGVAVYVDSLERHSLHVSKAEKAIGDMPPEIGIRALHYLQTVRQIGDPTYLAT